MSDIQNQDMKKSKQEFNPSQSNFIDADEDFVFNIIKRKKK
jgi:hypothetical protein